MEECKHDACEVSWEPIQMEYRDGGNAAVWQVGACDTCGAELYRDYRPDDAVER